MAVLFGPNAKMLAFFVSMVVGELRLRSLHGRREAEAAEASAAQRAQYSLIKEYTLNHFRNP